MLSTHTRCQSFVLISVSPPCKILGRMIWVQSVVWDSMISLISSAFSASNSASTVAFYPNGDSHRSWTRLSKERIFILVQSDAYLVDSVLHSPTNNVNVWVSAQSTTEPVVRSGRRTSAPPVPKSTLWEKPELLYEPTA
ncbi:hypothetical protein BAUCODRAFT_190438 [Baudoinia panamericana UAMH 10762]|uniref:Uncharacterized protein n=1 Tax=Baudoinia panamericana (strain UAMH 10762) TaxID=717646 RepID=M2NP00_BAUPA|nr:uncharacterized protein BAUCODRAFT_190438 [Baudoinia panamericana UAMH 10762]EMD00966.1 hypothetical protein BAUCODRAFT_190438 [Baudoinia panamericana UAMH 10762]